MNEVDRQPDDYSVVYQPEKASYSFSSSDLHVETEIMIPEDSSQIVMKLKITNKGDASKKVELTPVLNPYANFAQLKPWDKPEWYLKTGFANNPRPVFYTKLFNMDSDASKRRNISLWSSKKANFFEVSREKLL